jgi:chromosome segregation ATPase
MKETYEVTAGQTVIVTIQVGSDSPAARVYTDQEVAAAQVSEALLVAQPLQAQVAELKVELDMAQRARKGNAEWALACQSQVRRLNTRLEQAQAEIVALQDTKFTLETTLAKTRNELIKLQNTVETLETVVSQESALTTARNASLTRSNQAIEKLEQRRERALGLLNRPGLADVLAGRSPADGYDQLSRRLRELQEILRER